MSEDNERVPKPVTDDLPSVCPVCGAQTVGGYGLMGGGIGPYVFCEEDGCEFFAKRQDREGLDP